MPRTRTCAFDSSAWKSTPATLDANSLRLRMVDDLLRSQRLVGMSREQIEDLLGPGGDAAYSHHYDLKYYLGPERRFAGIDSEWLVFKLDSAGIVSEAKIVND